MLAVRDERRALQGELTERCFDGAKLSAPCLGIREIRRHLHEMNAVAEVHDEIDLESCLRAVIRNGMALPAQREEDEGLEGSPLGALPRPRKRAEETVVDRIELPGIALPD